MSDTVSVTVPASAGYLALLRTAAAAVAARNGLTLDEIDDVRLAVEEAAAALLRCQPDEIALTIRSDHGEVELDVAAALTRPIDLEQGSLGWMILAALANSLDHDLTDGVTTIRLTKRRGER